MTRQVEAVYENGALRPMEPLSLTEHQRVTITISDTPVLTDRSRLDVEYIERARKEVVAMARIPSLEEVQQRLSKIPGSMTEEFIAEREDR
ncbi:MAG: antitoxin family protein [Deltaproteobacteria bacterium]|nr:antitoxin family protein [Deltaproteobacteria bacterium]